MNNLARIRASQGKLQDAIASAREAIGLFDAMHDLYDAAQVRQNLAKYLRRAGQEVEARKIMTEAAAAYAQLGKHEAAARCQADLDAQAGLKGLPWWAWTGIVLAGVLVILFLLALAAEVD